MPYNGSGTFTPVYNWETDKANGIKIRADRMDGQDSDIATGLSNAVTRDGQSPATANLPMGAHKHTGVSAASSASDYLRADQYQKNDLAFFIAAGTDVYTLTPAPAITAYTKGMRFWIEFTNANLTTTPTLNISNVGAGTITKNGGQALAAGDIAASSRLPVICTTVSGGFEISSVISTLPATVQQFTDLGTQTTNYSFNGAADSKLQMYCNTTSGFNLTLPVTTHGRLLMLVKAGDYALNLMGTINGAAGTITLAQRQTMLLTYNTTDGWL